MKCIIKTNQQITNPLLQNDLWFAGHFGAIPTVTISSDFTVLQVAFILHSSLGVTEPCHGFLQQLSDGPKGYLVTQMNWGRAIDEWPCCWYIFHPERSESCEEEGSEVVSVHFEGCVKIVPRCFKSFDSISRACNFVPSSNRCGRWV